MKGFVKERTATSRYNRVSQVRNPIYGKIYRKEPRDMKELIHERTLCHAIIQEKLSDISAVEELTDKSTL